MIFLRVFNVSPTRQTAITKTRQISEGPDCRVVPLEFRETVLLTLCQCAFILFQVNNNLHLKKDIWKPILRNCSHIRRMEIHPVWKVWIFYDTNLERNRSEDLLNGASLFPRSVAPDDRDYGGRQASSNEGRAIPSGWGFRPIARRGEYREGMQICTLKHFLT